METDYLIETNIDDMNPQLYDYVMERLLKAGAMDVFYQPIQMKKNRPGIKFSVLCSKEKMDTMLGILFSETTTLGARVLEVGKVMQERSFKAVKTKYGSVPVKIGKWKGKVMNAAPEYEVCKEIAQKKKVPLKGVIGEVRKMVK